MSNNQFSLQALMIMVVIISVLCAVFFTAPEWVAGIFLVIALFLSMPASLALLVYGKDGARAFALGTMPPLAVLFAGFMQVGGRFDSLAHPGSTLEDRIFFAVSVCVVFTSGLIGQAIRWWCLQQGVSGSGDATATPELSEDTHALE